MNSRSRLCAAFALLILAVHADAWAASPLLGVTYGNQGWNMQDVQAMESWQGRRHAVLVMFTTWSGGTKEMNNLFNLQLPAIWNNGNVPMITWEMNTGQTTPSDIVTRAANGQYDSFVSTWASRLRAFLAGPDGILYTADDRRAYIRLAHEMNGTWYPWGQSPPADYIAMWRRVRSAFEALGLDATHVQWVWSVNNVDVGPHVAEEYYPGDAWVDWVAIDGYNWGGSNWQSPTDVLTPMLTRLDALAPLRPVAVTETGSTSTTASGTSIAAKSAWIDQLFVWVASAGVRMIAYFNLDTDSDFSVFGGKLGDGSLRIGRTTYKYFSQYARSVGAAALISPTAGDPRLITDADFAGQ